MHDLDILRSSDSEHSSLGPLNHPLQVHTSQKPTVAEDTWCTYTCTTPTKVPAPPTKPWAGVVPVTCCVFPCIAAPGFAWPVTHLVHLDFCLLFRLQLSCSLRVILLLSAVSYWGWIRATPFEGSLQGGLRRVGKGRGVAGNNWYNAILPFERISNTLPKLENEIIPWQGA